MKKAAVCLTAFVAPLMFGFTVGGQNQEADKKAERAPVVVFVCEHGAAKSIVAAAHFNRLAEVKVESWDGVPSVSGNYDKARDWLAPRLNRLLEELRLGK